MILSSIKVHGIGATRIFTNVNTDAPALHAATPFHPVLSFACVLMLGRHLLWPTSSSERSTVALRGLRKRLLVGTGHGTAPCERWQRSVA